LLNFDHDQSPNINMKNDKTHLHGLSHISTFQSTMTHDLPNKKKQSTAENKKLRKRCTKTNFE
tara:strand:+ start:1756 stop:1944 length:189 start_codon:yes stop_codon:yes gene_type:complete